jgi:hypothetical protein
MKTQVFFGIALRIVLMFSIVMGFTYIPEIIPASFFNDHDGSWGIRHYWYNIMMAVLFILSLIDAIVFIVNLVRKHYPGITV